MNNTHFHSLEIDLYNVCNARCPLCHFRTHYPEALKTRQELDRDFLENALADFTFERIHLTGDLGEPTLSPHILQVLHFLRERDPNVFICINTHGSTKTEAFWRELATALPRSHEVVFAIDGLEDTYSIYRVGLRFKKTIANARAFIDAGGIAGWSFIKFKHNQHQLAEARTRAAAMGFATFHARESYAEDETILRADDYVDNHDETAALAQAGAVTVVPKLFPYIQADGTLYSCTQSNCGRYDEKIDFDFDRLDLKSRTLADCLAALPDYCTVMQQTYPLTCARRCGEFDQTERPRGAEIGYGRRSKTT